MAFAELMECSSKNLMQLEGLFEIATSCVIIQHLPHSHQVTGNRQHF